MMKKAFVVLSGATLCLLCWSFMFKALQWIGGYGLMYIALIFALVAALVGIVGAVKGELGSKCFAIVAIVGALVWALGMGFVSQEWIGGGYLSLLAGILVPVTVVWYWVKTLRSRK